MRTLYPLWILSIPVIIYSVLQTGKIHPPYNKTTGLLSRPDYGIVHPVPLVYPTDSWPYFLQHLPRKKGPVLDFKGNPVYNQEKHVEILTYDVGTADLQQCADALMRIRAEYLFTRKKYSSIGFHFNSGLFYSWADYLKGIRPVFINRKQILSHHCISGRNFSRGLKKLPGYRICICEYGFAVPRITRY